MGRGDAVCNWRPCRQTLDSAGALHQRVIGRRCAPLAEARSLFCFGSPAGARNNASSLPRLHRRVGTGFGGLASPSGGAPEKAGRSLCGPWWANIVPTLHWLAAHTQEAPPGRCREPFQTDQPLSSFDSERIQISFRALLRVGDVPAACKKSALGPPAATQVRHDIQSPLRRVNTHTINVVASPLQ